MRLLVIRPGTAHATDRGQALPEFALIAPLFFLVILGIIQLGLLFSGQNGLTNAAREAARYASTLPTPNMTVAGTCAATSTNAGRIYQRLTTVSLPQYVAAFQAGNVTSGAGPLSGCATWALSGTGTGVAYCTQPNGDGTYGVRVRAAVVYRHPLFIPLVGRLFSATNTWQLGATEEMRVEGPNRPSAGGFPACT